ncbi:MAG: Lrp/AsnC family transcriptional regulator [Candidatus Micrarchaeota archaeon]
MEAKLDHIDIEILCRLRRNSKAQIKNMANELDVHQNTLLKRVKRLEGLGIIRSHRIDIDFERLGYETQAIVTIKIDESPENGDLMSEIKKIPCVEALYEITGKSDAQIMVRARDKDELLRVIKAVRHMRGVVGTISNHILTTHKHPAEFNPLEKE